VLCVIKMSARAHYQTFIPISFYSLHIHRVRTMQSSSMIHIACLLTLLVSAAAATAKAPLKYQAALSGAHLTLCPGLYQSARPQDLSDLVPQARRALQMPTSSTVPASPALHTSPSVNARPPWRDITL